MTPSSKEIARKILDKYLARPDWIDIGQDDCFVCGTPLKNEVYEKRTQTLVDAIAQAINQAVKDERESCAQVVINLPKKRGNIFQLPDYTREEVAECIRNRGEKES